MLRSPLLLHIPHASTCIPASELGDFVVDRATIDAERLRLTDRYTDALYGDGFPRTQIVAANISRLVVDVERFADDAHSFTETFFVDRGFHVGVNTPFAGALVPNAFYGRDARVQSVMIEVRRDLYMVERTGERLPGFADVQRVLTEFRVLLEAWSLATTRPSASGSSTTPADTSRLSTLVRSIRSM